MSNNRSPPVLDDSDENTPHSPGLPSGRLGSYNENERNTSQGKDGDLSPSNLDYRIVDAPRNTQTHNPGSSQTSVVSQINKYTTPEGGDVEAQAPDQLKGVMGTYSDFYQTWNNQFDIKKWYEWTAYYIPILEWLPQYKCNNSTNTQR